MTFSKNNKIVLILVFVTLLIPRFMFLDQDAPVIMVSGICQEDEPYYSIGALNMFLQEQNSKIANVKQPIATGVQLFITPFAYFSFKLFGNNYWALRLPVAIMGCIVLMLYFSFINRKIPDFKNKMFLILFFALDFYFFLFSRFNNPQLHSIFIISIICYLYCAPPAVSGFRKYFFIGFLSVFLITAVYLYNFYVLASVGLTAVIFAIKDKKYNNLFWLVVGGAVALLFVVIGLAYYNISVEKLMQTLFGIADSRGEVSLNIGVLDVFKKYTLTILQFAATNFIRFNLGYLVLMLLGMFLIFKEKNLLKNEYNLFFIICIVMLLFQSVFVVSYPFKKHITFLPILSFFIINQWQSIINFNYKSLAVKQKIYFVGIVVLSILLASYNVKVNNSEAYWAPFGYGYYENIDLKYIVLNAVLFLLLIASFFVSEKMSTYLKFTLLVPGALLIMDYCFINKSYTISKALKAMNGKYSNKIFVDGFTHAVQFYSGLVPTVSCYDRGIDYSPEEIDSLYNSSKPSYNLVKYFANSKHLNATGIGDTLVIHGKNFVFEEKIALKYYSFGVLRYINN